MNKPIRFFEHTDILERMVRKTIVRQSKLESKIAVLTMLVLADIVMQKSAIRYLYREIERLKKEHGDKE